MLYYVQTQEETHLRYTLLAIFSSRDTSRKIPLFLESPSLLSRTGSPRTQGAKGIPVRCLIRERSHCTIFTIYSRNWNKLKMVNGKLKMVKWDLSLITVSPAVWDSHQQIQVIFAMGYHLFQKLEEKSMVKMVKWDLSLITVSPAVWDSHQQIQRSLIIACGHVEFVYILGDDFVSLFDCLKRETRRLSFVWLVGVPHVGRNSIVVWHHKVYCLAGSGVRPYSEDDESARPEVSSTSDTAISKVGPVADSRGVWTEVSVTR